MGQKQNLCATDKARIYLREFASKQIVPKEQPDELSGMDTSKSKLFGPRYKDYFRQVNLESFLNRLKSHLSPTKTYFREENVSKATTKFWYVETNFQTYFEIPRCIYKFSRHDEQGVREIWMSSWLPRINESFACLEAQQNPMELSDNYSLSATLGLNVTGIPNQLST
jgi:hypothetical protein